MIHVYTGNGKGKTTAALGLALRAAGAGLKVYIGQFVKGGHFSELNSLKKIKNVKIEQFGANCFIKNKPGAKDIKNAQKGLKRIKEILIRQSYDVIVMDEINIALDLNLIKLKEAIDLIEQMPKDKELILTGRRAAKEILKLADLVSEIKEIKHYYTKGVCARKGIEY